MIRKTGYCTYQIRNRFGWSPIGFDIRIICNTQHRIQYGVSTNLKPNCYPYPVQQLWEKILLFWKDTIWLYFRSYLQSDTLLFHMNNAILVMRTSSSLELRKEGIIGMIDCEGKCVGYKNVKGIHPFQTPCGYFLYWLCSYSQLSKGLICRVMERRKEEKFWEYHLFREEDTLLRNLECRTDDTANRKVTHNKHSNGNRTLWNNSMHIPYIYRRDQFLMVLTRYHSVMVLDGQQNDYFPGKGQKKGTDTSNSWHEKYSMVQTECIVSDDMNRKGGEDLAEHIINMENTDCGMPIKEESAMLPSCIFPNEDTSITVRATVVPSDVVRNALKLCCSRNVSLSSMLRLAERTLEDLQGNRLAANDAATLMHIFASKRLASKSFWKQVARAIDKTVLDQMDTKSFALTLNAFARLKVKYIPLLEHGVRILTNKTIGDGKELETILTGISTNPFENLAVQKIDPTRNSFEGRHYRPSEQESINNFGENHEYSSWKKRWNYRPVARVSRSSLFTPETQKPKLINGISSTFNHDIQKDDAKKGDESISLTSSSSGCKSHSLHILYECSENPSKIDFNYSTPGDYSNSNKYLNIFEENAEYEINVAAKSYSIEALHDKDNINIDVLQPHSSFNIVLPSGGDLENRCTFSFNKMPFIPTLNPQDFALVANAYAKLNFFDESLFSGLSQHLPYVINDCSPLHLSLIINAYAKFRYRNPIVLNMIRNELLRPISAECFPDEFLLSFSKSFRRNSKRYTRNNKANAYSIWQYLNCRSNFPGNQLYETLSKYSGSISTTLTKLSQLDSGGVVMVLNSIAQLKFNDSLLVTKLLDHLMEDLSASHFCPSFLYFNLVPSEVVLVLNALAKLRVSCNEHYLNILCFQLKQKIETMNVKDISILSVALIKMSLLTEDLAKAILRMACTHIKSHKCNELVRYAYFIEKDLVIIANSTSFVLTKFPLLLQLGRDILTSLACIILKNLHRFKHESIPQIVEAFTCAKYYDEDLYQSLSVEISHRIYSFNLSDKLHILRMFDRSKYSFFDVELITFLQEQIISHGFNEWNEKKLCFAIAFWSNNSVFDEKSYEVLMPTINILIPSMTLHRQIILGYSFMLAFRLHFNLGVQEILCQLTRNIMKSLHIDENKLYSNISIIGNQWCKTPSGSSNYDNQLCKTENIDKESSQFIDQINVFPSSEGDVLNEYLADSEVYSIINILFLALRSIPFSYTVNCKHNSIEFQQLPVLEILFLKKNLNQIKNISILKFLSIFPPIQLKEVKYRQGITVLSDTARCLLGKLACGSILANLEILNKYPLSFTLNIPNEIKYDELEIYTTIFSVACEIWQEHFIRVILHLIKSAKKNNKTNVEFHNSAYYPTSNISFFEYKNKSTQFANMEKLYGIIRNLTKLLELENLKQQFFQGQGKESGMKTNETAISFDISYEKAFSSYDLFNMEIYPSLYWNVPIHLFRTNFVVDLPHEMIDT